MKKHCKSRKIYKKFTGLERGSFYIHARILGHLKTYSGLVDFTHKPRSQNSFENLGVRTTEK